MKLLITILIVLYSANGSLFAHGSQLCRERQSTTTFMDRFSRILQLASDMAFAIYPQKTPSPNQAKRTKIVAHRGAHNHKKGILENTFRAFDIALEKGIWGIEFDVRWTLDSVPVVHHDANTQRVFGRNVEISQVTAAELRNLVPEVPLLAEVVARYGGRMHFMIELKEYTTDRAGFVLQRMLRDLEPVQDYHFLSLKTELFENVDFVPGKTLLPVAEFNTASMSQAAIANGWGGVTGPYVLLNPNYQKAHKDAGQLMGTGHVPSRNALYREINREVEWIFTNHAVKLRKILLGLQY